MELKDRIIRKFKDINNNEYEIRQKKNRHYYLIIRENSKKEGKIISGSKNKIFAKLQEIHKSTNFIDLQS